MTHLMPNLWLMMFIITILMNMMMISINYFDFKLFIKNKLFLKMNLW